MEKWIVGGKPRMALFAGDNPIMTGDELTYDYNFDPFSAKNVQECRCGSDNCRGVLGPRPKDQKPVKETIKDAVKAGVKAGKRKLKELLGADGADSDRSPKKRKIKEATGVKRVASSASLKTAKGVAKVVKKSVSTSILSARGKVGAKRSNTVVVVKTRKVGVVRAYSKRSRNPSHKLTLNMEAESNPTSPSRPRRSGSAPRSVQKIAIKKAAGSKKSTSPKKTTSQKKAVPLRREPSPETMEEDTIEVVDEAGNDSDATQDDTSHSLLYLK
jgi:[histone H3]-lysine4 N-trimethyltransferase ASH1L